MTQTVPTIVFTARKILTMNPRQPEATHVAVRDGRVLAVGSLDRMEAWGPFDLDERFADKVLMPGLVEGHSHLMAGGAVAVSVHGVSCAHRAGRHGLVGLQGFR